MQDFSLGVACTLCQMSQQCTSSCDIQGLFSVQAPRLTHIQFLWYPGIYVSLSECWLRGHLKLLIWSLYLYAQTYWSFPVKKIFSLSHFECSWIQWLLYLLMPYQNKYRHILFVYIAFILKNIYKYKHINKSLKCIKLNINM